MSVALIKKLKEDITRLEEQYAKMRKLEETYLPTDYLEILRNEDEYLRKTHDAWQQILRNAQSAYDKAVSEHDEELKEGAELKTQLQNYLKEVLELPDDKKPMKLINKFLLGTDPEFYAVKKNRHVNLASTHGNFRDQRKIHYDHNGDVLELTPTPHRSSYNLVREINTTLFKHPDIHQLIEEGIRLKAGGIVKTSARTVTLGGHIHIDIPLYQKEHYDKFVLGGYRLSSTMFTERAKRLTEGLDILTDSLEKLDILPLKHSMERRNGGIYGRFGDIRAANDSNRIEYRTMCSWLHSPIASMLVLTGAKLVAAEPAVIKEVFTPTAGVSTVRLLKFFTLFKTKDSDAARVVEKVFEKGLPFTFEDKDLLTSWTSFKELKAA